MNILLFVIILFSNISVYIECKSPQVNYLSISHRNCTENDCRLSSNEISLNETQDFLLFTAKKSIMGLNLTTKSIYELNIPNLTAVSTVDFDVNTQCVYWAGSTINRQCLNNEQELLLSEDLKSVTDIALDWVSHNLYFVNNGHSKIELISIDTEDRMRTTILGNSVLHSPVSIAVHPKAGYMFWTDWSKKNPSVNRADLDGTNIKTLFKKSGVKSPFGITVDYVTGRIYFVDAGLKYIASCEFNGGLSKTILFKSKTTNYPYAIGIFKNKMYWSDWQYEVIFSADKEKGTGVEVLYRDLLKERPEILKIFRNVSRIDTNACDNSNCKYICVGKPEGSSCLCPNDLIYEDQACVCPRNVARFANLTCQQERPACLDDEFTCNNFLCVKKKQTCDGKNDCGDDSDEKNCPNEGNDGSKGKYLTLLPRDAFSNETEDFLLFCTKTSIMRLNLATNSVYKLNITNLTQVFAIDFDMNTQCVYWAADTISRQCLSNNEPEILLSENLKQIEGIALDWISHTLYFVNSNYSKIEMIRVDTEDRMRSTILDNKILEKPRGIALHPKRGYMFWTDWSATDPSVSRADLDGTNIKKLFEKSNVKWPSGIALDYTTERIYWADAGFQYIGSSDLNGNAFKVIRKSKFTQNPYAIGVFKNKIYWTEWKHEVVLSADKQTGDDIEVLYHNLLEFRAIDLKIFGSGSRIDTNACENTNCEYICVGKPKGSSCLCPNDLIYEDQKCVCPGVVAPFANLTCGQKRPPCLDDEFSCTNLLCVKKKQTCDGKNDCGDGSDEDCPRLVCKEGTHSCGLPNDQCIPLLWVCDGDEDCTSGSDEKNCAPSEVQ